MSSTAVGVAVETAGSIKAEIVGAVAENAVQELRQRLTDQNDADENTRDHPAT
jgi:hypothetical protein